MVYRVVLIFCWVQAPILPSGSGMQSVMTVVARGGSCQGIQAAPLLRWNKPSNLQTQNPEKVQQCNTAATCASTEQNHSSLAPENPTLYLNANCLFFLLFVLESVFLATPGLEL